MTAADMANLSFNMCHHKLNSLNQHWLSSPNLQRFADAMHNAGALLINCFGYLVGIIFVHIYYFYCFTVHNGLEVISYFIFNHIFICVPICIIIYFPWLFWVYFVAMYCFFRGYYECILIWSVFTFYFLFLDYLLIYIYWALWWHQLFSTR